MTERPSVSAVEVCKPEYRPVHSSMDALEGSRVAKQGIDTAR
jgi:hypothetical protein